MNVSTVRGGTKKKKRPSAKSPPSGKSGRYVLPTKRSETTVPFGKALQLWHGDPFAGKTSTAARFPDGFFLLTEPGTKGKAVFREYIKSWKDVVGWIDSILETNRFSPIIFDVADTLYDMCLDHVCKENRWKYPTDAGYGRGWRAVKDEFKSQMGRLVTSERGIVFIAHSKVQEYERRNKGTFHKIIPQLGGQAYDYIWGLSDIQLHFGFYGEDRYITVDGGDFIETGNRFENKFIAKNGRPVVAIPMGKGPDESYANLVKAYNNGQPTSGKPKVQPGTGVRAVKFQPKK